MHFKNLQSFKLKMLRRKQYTVEQRVLFANGRARGDSYKAINWDFKKSFPFDEKDPGRDVIYKTKRKFDKEGNKKYWILLIF